MSAFTWTDDKQAAPSRSSLARRLVYGPALIIAFAIGASGVLAFALLLSSILEI
jgi:hypothetical protein